MIWLLGVVGLAALLVWAPYLLGRVKHEIIVVEWESGFIRWFPNPGLKIKNFHMCTNKDCARWSKGKNK